jgi:hypothetical protein
MTRVDGKQVRSYYSGFLINKFSSSPTVKEEHQNSLVLDCTESLFDEYCAD